MPNKYVRVIRGITFIDSVALELSIDKSTPAKDRLRQKMIHAGVAFWNESQTIVKKPVIGISSIGGFSVSLEGLIPEGMIKLRMGKITLGPVMLESLAEGLRETMGMQSAPTYMNSNAKSPKELYVTTVDHGHFSIAHGAGLGILCLGISKKAELEFDVQRDLVHLARETSARCAAQDAPTMVAMTASGAAFSEEILASTAKILDQFKKEGATLDWREERNSLYPLSATVSLGINGTLRNFQKLVADVNSEGKELEYRNALALINDSFHGFFPELFKSSASYGHQYPVTWVESDGASSELAKEQPSEISNGDLFIPLPEMEPIFNKSNVESRSLRVVVITSNVKKFQEFNTQLGEGYGVDVQQWPIKAGVELDKNAICLEIMREHSFSPHFILCEKTSLTRRKDGADLTHFPLEQLAKHRLESVIHSSVLEVYKPQWFGEEKILSGFTLRQYEKRSYGYIHPHGDFLQCKDGFGWDALFVNAATNLTNEEFYSKYGKKSARQYVISDFIETYLRYKTLVGLKHHELKLQRPIDFGDHFIHLSEFVAHDPYFSNPFIDEWGIGNLRNAMFNEGLFGKAALSRVVRNYFSPPFSGLPFTGKKDAVEETIFMTHDILHHLVCDLVCDLTPSKAHFYVYSAWRMASEACTLVLADMFYADGLIQSGVPRSGVDQRIYPLFEAIKRTQKQPESKDEKIKFIQRLLFANIKYALLGDDTEWKALLDLVDFKLLEAYKNHFGKFFIGDNAWTRANFNNMYRHSTSLQEWISNIGEKTFRAANVPLLSDTVKLLKAQQVDLRDYPDVVDGIFNLIFNSRIRPLLDQDKIELEEKETLQSRAFRRFLIGQVSLFARYPTPLNMEPVKKSILLRIQNNAPFSHAEQDEIHLLMEQYILGIEGLRLMSREEALNAIDCSSVFPPVYISYPAMQKQYGTIESCVKECIEGYDEAVFMSSKFASNPHRLFTGKQASQAAEFHLYATCEI